MKDIPEEKSAQRMLDNILEDERNHCATYHKTFTVADAVNAGEWDTLIDEALEIYHGPDHDKAHQLLLENINNLKYETVLMLWGQFVYPLTVDTVELQTQLFAAIMRHTSWNGTNAMLELYPNEWPGKDLILGGYYYEYYSYTTEVTPQEVIFTTRRFFYDKDPVVVRAALAVIYGWFTTSHFKDADDFLAELQTLSDTSHDEAVKFQIKEIFEAQEKMKRIREERA